MKIVLAVVGLIVLAYGLIVVAYLVPLSPSRWSATGRGKHRGVLEGTVRVLGGAPHRALRDVHPQTQSPGRVTDASWGLANARDPRTVGY